MSAVLALALVAAAVGAAAVLFQVGRHRPPMPIALLAMAAGGAAGYPVAGNQGAAICFTAAALVVTLGYVVGPPSAGQTGPPRRYGRGGPSAAGG